MYRSDPVTHIVAELDHDKEEVLEALQSKAKASKQDGQVLVEEVFNKAEVVFMDWFTECMEEARPVEVTDLHRVKAKPKVQ